MGPFQEFVDELNQAYIQWHLEYRQNARLAKLALTTWWDGLWPRMPEVDWQRELDELQEEWLERGIRINADDAERMRAYLTAWQANSRKRAEEATALALDQAQPSADGGVSIPLDPALAEQIADQRWYELLTRLGQHIFRYSPPEEWVGEAERTAANVQAPAKWRRSFLEWIEAERQERLASDALTSQLFDALSEIERERRRAESDHESRLWRFAKAVDEYVATDSPKALVAVFRELIDALPDQVPSTLFGGETQPLLRSVQTLLHLVADFIEALPPEAAGVGIELLQLVLDLVGLIPGFGEPADVINAAIAFRRGEYLDVALGVGSLLPLGGQLPGAAKILRRLDRIKDLVAKFGGALGLVLRQAYALFRASAGRLFKAASDLFSSALPSEGVLQAISRALDEASVGLERIVRELSGTEFVYAKAGSNKRPDASRGSSAPGGVGAKLDKAPSKPAAPSEWTTPPGQRLPAIGKWSGTPGNSDFIPDDPELLGLKEGDVIPFHEGFADLSKWSQGELPVKDMTGNHRRDRRLAHAELARENQWLINGKTPDVRKAARWLSRRNLRLHHASPTAMQFIPRALHDALAHAGFASFLRRSQP